MASVRKNRADEIGLLGGLSPAEVSVVLNRAVMRKAAAGRYLFRQGDAAQEIFVLESGRVRLNEITEDGTELLYRLVSPGQTFGDRGAVSGMVYGSSAHCDTDVQVRAWKTADFGVLLDAFPKLATNLFEITMNYLHRARRRHRMLATQPVETRVRWALSSLAASIGNPQGEAMVIAAPAVETELAKLADTTLYSVSRLLADYQRRGLLQKRRGRIVLLPAFR